MSYGIASLNCVCKCNNGFLYSCNPNIHDLAGENVCIQVITPAQFSSAFAALNNSRIDLLSINVGFNITSKGNLFDLLRFSTIIFE